MKCSSPVARVILSVVAALVFAQAAAAQHSVPFKGALQGSFTATPVPPFPPQFVDVVLTATGNATQLGGFTAVFAHRVDLSTRIGGGTYTFTAANGDILVADVIGQATEVAPNVLRVVEMGTITGGTGRFADASGEFTMERLLDQVNLTTIGRFQGTIHRRRRWISYCKRAPPIFHSSGVSFSLSPIGGTPGVPEPSTLVLVGMGLIGIWISRIVRPQLG